MERQHVFLAGGDFSCSSWARKAEQVNVGGFKPIWRSGDLGRLSERVSEVVLSSVHYALKLRPQDALNQVCHLGNWHGTWCRKQGSKEQPTQSSCQTQVIAQNATAANYRTKQHRRVPALR